MTIFSSNEKLLLVFLMSLSTAINNDGNIANTATNQNIRKQVNNFGPSPKGI